MSLAPGTRFGHYSVLSRIGAGGMGEVYRAQDTRLGRDVAIKVLPDAMAEDGERLARFRREAKTLAALNHANIAQVHGFEERDGVTALVMEFVDGEDLSARIARGAVAVPDAVPIARQIASALEAAHEQGIVHRDLKPANVKVRADGTVKVLDYGLAKAAESSDGPEAAEHTHSPTLTLTQTGVILGTAAYMAPEQAHGRAVDRRADVWAFGALVFEMLTGTRAFPGDGVAGTLAAVIAKEPDWSQLPPGLPKAFVVCLKRCLRKDPRQRMSDMATMRLALEGAFEAENPRPAMAVDRPRSRTVVWTLAAVAVLSLAFAGVVSWSRFAASPGAQTRLTIALPPGAELTSYPAITPDGRLVAYVSQQAGKDPQLYLRDLNSFDPRVVPASDGARQPFFSPNGNWVAFFAQGQLLKAEVTGGAPVRVADAAYPFGGTWTRDDAIIYATSLGSGLWEVPAAGGTPKQLTTPDGKAGGYAHVFPQVLPGDRRVLFTIWGQARGSAVLSRDSRTWDLVLPASSASYNAASYDPSAPPSGRLLVVDDAAGIRVAPFDPANPVRTGVGASVLDDVFNNTEVESLGWLAVSSTGTAVYAAGNPSRNSLVWLGTNGVIAPHDGRQQAYRESAVSPDGTRAVIRQGSSLWVQDLTRGTIVPVTSGDSSYLPVWSRDGRRVVFASNRGGDWDIYSQPADGSGPAEVLVKQAGDQYPYSLAPDGTLLYMTMGSITGRDLWTRSPGGQSVPLRVTPFNELAAQFRPEAAGAPRWIAYTSDESGRSEVYVQSYPKADRRIAVSSGGGVRPMWSPDGKELYYATADAIVAVPMQPDATPGAPRRLADRSQFLIDDRFHSYSVSPDGKRLLMIHRDSGSIPRALNVILNWASPPD